jgi:hypothetical protein
VLLCRSRNRRDGADGERGGYQKCGHHTVAKSRARIVIIASPKAGVCL